MAKLILNKFTCISETNEVAPSDSPYFLVFVGDHQAGSGSNCDVKLVRRASWDDQVDAGETRVVNITVSDGTDLDLVLVALMEEDWDTDFVGQKLTQVRQWMQAMFNPLANSISTGIDGTIAELVRTEFAKVLKLKSSNDDVVRVKRLVVNGPGNYTLSMIGAGNDGHYKATFKVA